MAKKKLITADEFFAGLAPIQNRRSLPARMRTTQRREVARLQRHRANPVTYSASDWGIVVGVLVKADQRAWMRFAAGADPLPVVPVPTPAKPATPRS